MYFVDRNKIEQTLAYMETLVEELEKSHFRSFTGKLALQRIAHVVIESILDIGNMMIDGFIMRDPGSYDDIMDILIDENVLPEEDGDYYKAVIRLRKMIVKDYLAIDHAVLEGAMMNNKERLKNFASHIRVYLDQAQNGANAFSNRQA